MSEITVREAISADVEAIAGFFWKAWRMTGPDAPGWAGASEEAIAEITTEEAVLQRIGGPERRMFLAWDDDEVVGFAASRVLTEEEIELAGIVVLDTMLGRGIGTPLLDAAVAAAKHDGFTRMIVKTEDDNDRALGFYRSRGFEDSRGDVEDIDGVTVKLAVLTRELV